MITHPLTVIPVRRDKWLGDKLSSFCCRL